MNKRLNRLIKKLFLLKTGPVLSNPWKQRVWSIGVYKGEDPLNVTSPKDVSNPVLTCKDISDVQADLIADPFMLRVKHTWYLFFEVLSWATYRGQIGLATSEDGINWNYQQIVLAEPFHLSYPYVFEWLDNYYMIPESYQANSVRLYKATKFPAEWSFIGTLLSDGIFVDTTVFRHNDKWWLFTTPKREGDVLCLYYADYLRGPWLEHPQSPIIEGNPHIARPAGRVVNFNGRVIRYAQDCAPIYGTEVRAFEITELTTTNYREREVDKCPVLGASGFGWNGLGMHHIDPHQLGDRQWLACVDGWSINSLEQSY